VRARLGAALAALAVAGAGCGDEGSLVDGGYVEGDTLTVYVSAPFSGAGGAYGRDLRDGAKLALFDAGGRAGEYAVNFAALGAADPDQALANARRAIRDPAGIAYLGETDLPRLRRSLPILNAAGLAQLVPFAPPRRDVRQGSPSGVRTVGTITRSRLPRPAAAAFERSFGRAPGPGAAAGYRGMRRVLDVVARAGERGGQRPLLVRELFDGAKA